MWGLHRWPDDPTHIGHLPLVASASIVRYGHTAHADVVFLSYLVFDAAFDMNITCIES